MDAIAVITALYIALWVGVYKDDIKRDIQNYKAEQAQQAQQEEKQNGK